MRASIIIAKVGASEAPEPAPPSPAPGRPAKRPKANNGRHGKRPTGKLEDTHVRPPQVQPNDE